MGKVDSPTKPVDELEECDVCGDQHDTSQCPLLKAVKKVRDVPVPSRARLTLPENLKLIKRNGKFSVLTKANIPSGTQFGPLEAPTCNKLIDGIDFPLLVFSKGNYDVLDTTDENRCNWMCYLSVKNEKDANLIAYQVNKSIYFSTQKELLEGEELKLAYSVPYGKRIASTGIKKLVQNLKLSSNIFEDNDENTISPPKRKRGRPRKVPQTSPINNEPSKTPEKEEKISKAKALGIKNEKEKWICSQCTQIFFDCIEFAKHLQSHYKPSRKRRACSEFSQDQQYCDKEKEVNNILQDNEKVNDETLEHNEVETNSNLTTSENVHNKPSKNNSENEITETEQESSHSTQDTKSTDTIQEEEEVIKTRPTLQDENTTPNDITDNSMKKRKSEIIKEQQQQFKEKKFEIVSRKISQSAFGKYNLRSRRKALILIDGPNDKEVSESDDDDDDDDDEDDDVDESKEEEYPYIEDGIKKKKYMHNDSDTSEEGESKPKLRKAYSRKVRLYKCDLCNKSFDKTICLFRHIIKHTGKYMCKKCHKAFARKENLLKHSCSAGTNLPSETESENETDNRKNRIEYPCEYCKMSFFTEKLLERHKIKHTGEFTCTECKKSFATKEILTNHICPMKPNVEEFTCTICSKTFSKERYLFKHLPVHTGKHSCPICGKWLSSLASLTNHMRICGQVKEIEVSGQAKCPNCNMIFTDVAEFRHHQYEHTHLFACETCGARFRQRFSLKLHVCQGKDLICDVCNKIFVNNESLQRHKSNHGKTVYKCTDCEKTFHWKDSLLKHSCKKPDIVTSSNLKSSNLKPLICDICGSSFSCNSSLKIHKTIHGQKNFSCEDCGKKFHRKDMLTQHQAVHREPTYRCPTCNKLFKTKRSLCTHEMIHDGVKPFKCGKCGKEFFQKKNLHRHEETHNNNRKGYKYVCSICQKSFISLEYQYLHLLEHSKTCGVCGRTFLKVLTNINKID
ncbi:zinc finger protein 568-like [Centruroides sculpturatus]|uniref:zinc finger protein 568-like n=1 Tax=Centruroides sculpturatus TaxID=218467 RepID=UPI000C6E281F|nr:zinc finger protein 568-like [Centruroides sculpturatus]